MASGPRRLYLFDCDGGRGNLFADLQQNEIPSDCELYLFWNNIDPFVTEKLQLMHSYQRIHLAPSYLKNVKNSADGKLIYFLGKLAKDFDTITIIGGGDCVYEEVIEAVKSDFPTKKILLKIIGNPKSYELQPILNLPSKHSEKITHVNEDQLVQEVFDGKSQTLTRTLSLSLNQSIQCPECSDSTRKYCPSALRMHLLSSSKHSKKILEVSKVPVNMKDNNLFCAKSKVKLLHPLIGGRLEIPKKGKVCSLCTGSTQKYKAMLFYKHLKDKHPQCVDVGIQCCNS